MTRQAHMHWCKKRAIGCLDAGDVQEAIASMLSDLTKHPETAKSAELGFMLSMSVRSPHDCRRFIMGFN